MTGKQKAINTVKRLRAGRPVSEASYQALLDCVAFWADAQQLLADHGIYHPMKGK